LPHFNQHFKALVKSGEMNKVVEAYGFKHVNDLIAHVGFGKLTPLQILNKALPDLAKQEGEAQVEERNAVEGNALEVVDDGLNRVDGAELKQKDEDRDY